MNMLVNGVPGTLIHCTDRGLQYGDGLFETIAFKNGRLLSWQAHMDRLSQACVRLNLPAVDESTWIEDIRKLEIKDENRVIKLIITRGIGDRGYAASTPAIPTRIVAAYPWPDHSSFKLDEGIRVRICHTQISVNPVLAGLKHLNRLDNVLARNEWTDKAIAEGLMLDDQDHVIEGTMSNIFAVKNSVIYTPRLIRAGVEGVLRSIIIKIALKNNIKLEETDLKRNDLVTMEEIFVTNSIIGVWPVHEIDGHNYAVGAVTKLMMHKLTMEEDYYAL